MEHRKTKTDQGIIHVSDIPISPEPSPVLEIVRHYRRTGGFRRKDLRRVLGDKTKGVSAGEKGLEDILSGK